MSRRAYILVFVLGVTTVVVALGLTYIQSNGTVMQQASNRQAAVRAQYVAESGIALAQHYIHYPPTTVAYNGVWAGGAGIAIDSTYDTVDITVTPTSPVNHYTLVATATVRNAAGTQALAKQTVTVDAIIPPEPKWKIAQAALMTGTSGTSVVSSGVILTGNVHSNGTLIGNGTCTGAVSATGTALWTGGGPPSSVRSLQPAVSAPPVSTALYTTYKVNHTSYSAYTAYSKDDMGAPDVAPLSAAVNAGGTNPGRIVLCKLGDFKIKNGVNFTGTLLVCGDLILDDASSITAVANYPALVVTGNIRMNKDDAVWTINGPVICGGEITDGGKKNCQFTVNGTVIVKDGLNRSASGTTIRIVWDSARTTFWDFAKTANPKPYTTTNWKEN